MSIYFYSHKKDHGYMSNFYNSPININGTIYPTTEHYFQACKMTTQLDHETIRNSKSPHTAANLGSKLPMRSDWFLSRDGVMLEALRYKFHQHPHLFHLLINTGTTNLIEHTKKDRYWADGGDGTGHNMLGKLLMQVRSECQIIHNLGFQPLDFYLGIRLYSKYHGQGYYQVIIDWMDNTYQLLLCGGNNGHEVQDNEYKLRNYITNKGAYDMFLTYSELSQCINLTYDSPLCTKTCSTILSMQN